MKTYYPDDPTIDYLYKIDFSSWKRFFESKFTENDIVEKVLFELSNRIGSFIIYLLLFSMNPNNHSKRSSRETYKVVEKMVKTGISEVIPFLVPNFRDFINRLFAIYQKDKDSSTIYLDEHPIFEKTVIKKLIEAFDNIYPRMTFELEKIVDIRPMFGEVLKGKPTAIERYRQDRAAFYEILKKQQTCEHEYGKPIKTIYGFIGQQCKKCHYINKLKKSNFNSIQKNTIDNEN